MISRLIRYSASVLDYVVVVGPGRTLITGLENSDFSKEATLDGSPVTLAVTVTEINATTRPGWYKVEFTAPAAGKTLLVTLKNSTYFAAGKAAQYDLTTLDIASGGAKIVTITIENQDSEPIPGVGVTIQNAAQTVTLVGGLTTDANGQVTVALDDGSYAVVLLKGGVTFTIPETLTVSGNTSVTYSGDSFEPDLPTGDEQITVYGYTTDIIGQVVENYRLAFKPVGENLLTDSGQAVDTSERIVFTDENGFFSINLIKTSEIDITKSVVNEARYRVTHGPNSETRDFQTPASVSSVNFADLVFDTDGTIL